jgi:hypothetical protein
VNKESSVTVVNQLGHVVLAVFLNEEAVAVEQAAELLITAFIGVVLLDAQFFDELVM